MNAHQTSIVLLQVFLFATLIMTQIPRIIKTSKESKVKAINTQRKELQHATKSSFSSKSANRGNDLLKVDSEIDRLENEIFRTKSEINKILIARKKKSTN